MNKESFSYRVKKEIIEKPLDDNNAILSEIYAMFLVKDILKSNMIFKTEVKILALRLCQHLEKLGINYKISYISSKKMPIHNIFAIIILDEEALKEKISKHKLVEKYFIIAMFLISGYIKEPHKSYSIDFFLSQKEAIEIFTNIMIKENLKYTIKKSKTNDIIYMRSSDIILDFLIYIDAINSYFYYQNTIIDKEISLKISRNMNYELANETKKFITSAEQIKMIEFIDKNIGLDKLHKNLREVAYLRLENEEASLQELASMINLTKSGIRNRFRRIKEIYEEANK